MTMRVRALLTSLCAAAVVSVAAGCSDDDNTNPTVNPLVGTWNATSVMTPSGDVVSNGMALTVVVGSSGSISLAITGDQMGLCNPGPDCTVSGTWTSTDNTITILSGTDTITLSYTMSGDNMTWAGTLAGVTTTISLNRT